MALSLKNTLIIMKQELISVSQTTVDFETSKAQGMIKREKKKKEEEDEEEEEEEEEVWNEEINEEDVDECAEEEDEVRVIEFKRKHREGSPLKEESLAREDSPLGSPGSQPGTPDEQPVFGKKGDIARNSYSRYNTISYRKIRKGNTKQRIDEFESMMHL